MHKGENLKWCKKERGKRRILQRHILSIFLEKWQYLLLTSYAKINLDNNSEGGECSCSR